MAGVTPCPNVLNECSQGGVIIDFDALASIQLVPSLVKLPAQSLNLLLARTEVPDGIGNQLFPR
jgi:hypothetical protein